MTPEGKILVIFRKLVRASTESSYKKMERTEDLRTDITQQEQGKAFYQEQMFSFRRIILFFTTFVVQLFNKNNVLLLYLNTF